MFEVRPFESEDRASVVALWQEVFPGDPPWNSPEAMIARKLTVQPEMFLVGVIDGALVATVLAGFDGVRGWIYHLAVSPSHRRRGFGGGMIRAVEAGLARLGCPKVNLQVRVDNAQVVAFYRSLGYDVEERISMGRRL